MVKIPLTTGKRRQTLAQVLMTFYVLVDLVNEFNIKDHNYTRTLSKDIMGDLKKEMTRMGTHLDYSNTHLHMHIDEINDKLNERNYILWLEDFIYNFISYRDNTLFLTYDNWEHIHRALYDSDVKLLSPFRKIHVQMMGRDTTLTLAL